MSRQTLFERLPEVFVLSFKRFVYDFKTSSVGKVTTHVDILMEFQVPPMFCAGHFENNYRLIAGYYFS